MQLLAERWVGQGQNVWVLTRQIYGRPLRETINGVKVYRLPALWLPGLSWLTFGVGALILLIGKASSIGCLIAQMLNVATLPAALFSNLTGTPLLIKASAGGRDGNIQGLRHSRFGELKLAILLKACDYAIAINEEIVKELAAEKVPPFKIQLIPNGVDVEHFIPASESRRVELRKSMGFSAEETLVLFVGRLEPVKNLDFFLMIWQQITAAFPKARFLIVGDGSQRAALEAKATQLGLKESVKFLGAQSSALSFYQATDLLVLPSLREGISNALLEAMACGLPAIASEVGGNVDVLKDLGSNILLSSADASAWMRALSQWLRETSNRQNLGIDSRVVIEGRFSSEATSAAYLNLYANVKKSYFKQNFPILAYHRICREPRYGIDLSIAQFERQVRWLSTNGYRSTSLAGLRDCLEKDQPLPEKSVIITFDDGHREVFDVALPILNRYGFKATLFLNPGLMGKRWWVGGRRPDPVIWHETQPADYQENTGTWRVYDLMTWEQAIELHRQGFEIGSHALTHPFLTLLTKSELTQQVVESKRQLEEKLGQAISFFCYPSGDFDPRVKKAVLEAGYQAAVYSPDHYDIGSYWDDPAAWERIGLWRDVQFWKFKALVEGWYPRVFRAVPRSLWNVVRSGYRLGAKPDRL